MSGLLIVIVAGWLALVLLGIAIGHLEDRDFARWWCDANF